MIKISELGFEYMSQAHIPLNESIHSRQEIFNGRGYESCCNRVFWGLCYKRCKLMQRIIQTEWKILNFLLDTNLHIYATPDHCFIQLTQRDPTPSKVKLVYVVFMWYKVCKMILHIHLYRHLPSSTGKEITTLRPQNSKNFPIPREILYLRCWTFFTAKILHRRWLWLSRAREASSSFRR